MVVNLSGARFQCQVKIPWDELEGISCRLTDLFTGAVYERGAKKCCLRDYTPTWRAGGFIS